MIKLGFFFYSVHYSSKFTTMTLNQPIPLAPRAEFLKLAVSYNKILAVFCFKESAPVLMNIHLVVLFHTQDLQKYSFDVILEQLINVLKILECQSLSEKNDCQTVFSEDDPKVILRGKDVYKMHCQSLRENSQLKTLCGLKKNSTLNSLKYFHVCNNYSFDIMRDLLEGVAQYEVILLFGYLAQHFISEQDLLSRIYGFDFGFLER